MTLEPSLDMYVLDTLANDIEDADSVLRMLNSDTDLGWRKEWGREFTMVDVVSAMSRLIRGDFVRVLALDEDSKNFRELGRRVLPSGSYSDVYYAMTERGRLLHSNWDPDT